MKKQYNEELTDLAIKHAGHEILEEIAQETPPNADGMRLSNDFEKRMQRIIKGDLRKRRVSRALKVTAKVAAIIMVFLVISTVVVFSSEALRSTVFNLFYETGGVSTEIDFSDADSSGLPEGLVMPGYIPAGYKLVDATKNGTMYTSILKNSAGDIIIIEQGKVNAHLSADSEGEDTYETEFMGEKIYVIESEEINMVFFNSSLYGFTISGDIKTSELLAIAESILK